MNKKSKLKNNKIHINPVSITEVSNEATFSMGEHVHALL